jgi:Zn-dependent M28 family amino/carboxypeptidase
MRRSALALLSALLAPSVLGAPSLLGAGPAVAADRAASIADPDTRAWWAIAEHLSSDAMEGRDIGSPGHERAGRWVAEQFRAAGLTPAGDNGTFFQSFPVHESRVEAANLSVVQAAGPPVTLRFLRDFSVRAADDLPAAVEGPLVFAGYCRPQDLAGARGKVAVCFNTRRTGLTSGGERIRNAQAAGAAALVQVDDPGFTIEPYRWPAAYARTITLAEGAPPVTGGFPVLTMSAVSFARIAQGSGHDGMAVLETGGRKEALPVFDLPGRLQATFKATRRDFTATNVLAVLPGSDPALRAEHVVVSAHLDGYGFGEPVAGDGLYNGALDDAAYVGTLIRFAQNHGPTSKGGKPLKRSVLLAAFTGEEKGLLGANWFVRHPTVPKISLVADINLDQLRPLFPLKLMTVHAIDESTLGATAREVAAAMGIRTQPDLEPERSLVTRADHYPFMQIGVPATGFIFGYEPGTEAERRYREWYQVRYHRPQDDTSQPMDFEAAGAFNRFLYKLTETVADAPQRPTWTPGSHYAP